MSEQETVLPDGDGRIVASPGVCGGRPRVRGTRITVSDLLRALAAGDTIDGLVESFPYLSQEDVLAALKYAASNLSDRIVIAA
jgi:uncharacterized protein (DUF433 family)